MVLVSVCVCVCVSEWLSECTVQKLVLVITCLETHEVLERWQFDIECDKTAKESRYTHAHTHTHSSVTSHITSHSLHHPSNSMWVKDTLSSECL